MRRRHGQNNDDAMRPSHTRAGRDWLTAIGDTNQSDHSFENSARRFSISDYAGLPPASDPARRSRRVAPTCHRGGEPSTTAECIRMGSPPRRRPGSLRAATLSLGWGKEELPGHGTSLAGITNRSRYSVNDDGLDQRAARSLRSLRLGPVHIPTTRLFWLCYREGDERI